MRARRAPQVERLHAAGERSGLATAVMEHAHTLVHVANALYVRKEFEEAKVRACALCVRVRCVCTKYTSLASVCRCCLHTLCVDHLMRCNVFARALMPAGRVRASVLYVLRAPSEVL